MTTTDLVSHALALLIGLLIGALVNWEDIRAKRRGRGDTEAGWLRVPYLILAGLVASLAATALLVTPLDLDEIARWQGIRWMVALTAGAAALTMVAAMVRAWGVMPRRTRGIATTVVVVVSAEAYFQVEAFFYEVPLTGIRNLVMFFAVMLLFLVQLVDWRTTARPRE